MRFINVEAPHGFLIMRGKQTTIASDKALPVDEPLMVVCDGEAYGQVTLSSPAAVNLSEFERLETDHAIRPEERKLFWPGAEEFYLHAVKTLEPMEESLPVRIDGDQAEIMEQPELSEGEQQVVSQAQRLPRTILVSGDAVALENGDIEIDNHIDWSKAIKALSATMETKGINGRLPLYRLALVRQPHFIIRRGEVKKKTHTKQGDNMPYGTTRDNAECNGVAVIKEGTGEVMGCHNNEDEANAQIAALNASESKEMDELYNEGAPPVNVPHSFVQLRTMEHAHEAAEEAMDLTEQFGMLSGFILKDPAVSDKPAALEKLANEYAQLVRDAMSGRMQKALEAESESSDSPDVEEPLPVDDKAGRRLKKTWKRKLQDAYDTIKEMLSWAEYEEEGKGFLKGHTGFAIKQIQGEPWFFAWSTNAFQDRQGEIFSTKALEQYVAEAEKKEERGTFNFWHIAGTDYAKKQWQGVVGRILVEAGPFLKDDKGRAALKFFKQYPDGHPDIAPEGWGNSPEYRFLPEDRDDGVYDWLWITRTSVLPKAAAANIYTRGGLQMALSDEQKKAAELLFGEDQAAQIVAEAEAESKNLEEAGVAHKSDDEPETEAEDKAGGGRPQEIEIEAIVAQLAKQIEPDMTEFTAAVKALGEQVEAFNARLEKLEKGEAVKEQAEMPRYLLSWKRASEAPETEVKESDPLLKQKPAETVPDKSGAANFFPTPRR